MTQIVFDSLIRVSELSLLAVGLTYAHYNGFIAPNHFLPLETFLIWSMVILGGAGNHLDALLGTLITELIYNATRFLGGFFPGDENLLASLRMVLIGVLIIVVIVYLPHGLVPERKRRYGSRNAS